MMVRLSNYAVSMTCGTEAAGPTDNLRQDGKQAHG